MNPGIGERAAVGLCAELSGAAADFGASLDLDGAKLLERATPVPLAAPGIWSPNRHCRMVEAGDGWLAVNLARDEDRRAVPAWLEGPLESDTWDTVIDACRSRAVAEMLESAILLGLPVSTVGERKKPGPTARGMRVFRRDGRLRGVDLSALWAGPLCGALLARCGIAFDKVEAPGRPDPTAGDASLNGANRRRTLELDSPELLDLIAAADILITSSRPLALARKGMDEAALRALNPGLLWIAITAHGWHGPEAWRVGFGDDCAAAGGLVSWNGAQPNFAGDALADPLTGIAAATAALGTLAGGYAGLLDISLAGTAADAAARFGG